MGILQSIARFFGCNTEDEEAERSKYPYLLHRRHNHHNSFDDTSERLPKMLIFGCSIYEAIRGLLQKVRFVICFPIRPRKTADPLLPIQNLASTISSEPLLVQTTHDSIPESDEPTTFAFVAELNTDEQELHCDNVDGLSSQQWPEENKRSDEVIMCLTLFVEENASGNVASVEESMELNSIEEEDREAEKVKIQSIVVVDEERWVKPYSSRHRILLVGEGDFSFSASLAAAFGCASNMIATSLNSKAFLRKNYGRAPSNIEELRSRECKVMHGIDATEIANHSLLGHVKFDRIIFNFPFAGFFKNLTRESQLRRHRRLVSLFLKNAKEMMSENGEIHISHKTNGFHVEFKLESIASSHGLGLIEAVKFNCADYPGYKTKHGFGGDNNFNCNPSKTFKFGLKRFQC